jgi:hypothetical protein
VAAYAQVILSRGTGHPTGGGVRGVVGGSVPTAGAAAAERVISGGKESDKSSRASGAGNE